MSQSNNVFWILYTTMYTYSKLILANLVQKEMRLCFWIVRGYISFIIYLFCVILFVILTSCFKYLNYCPNGRTVIICCTYQKLESCTRTDIPKVHSIGTYYDSVKINRREKLSYYNVKKTRLLHQGTYAN